MKEHASQLLDLYGGEHSTFDVQKHRVGGLCLLYPLDIDLY